MAGIPAKIHARLTATLKRFQPILASAKSRDVNESDTVTIVKDMLAEVFGYDKYSEVTTEFAIRSTYCDLAVKLDGKASLLIEVKAIGLELKDQHVRQAIDYGANQGLDWVCLTNGTTWRIYRVHFTKPVREELLTEFDVLALNSRSDSDLEKLFLLCKEGFTKNALEEFHTSRQATSRFLLGQLVLSEGVLSALRRELRAVCPEVKIGIEELRQAVQLEVLKREILEGEESAEAKKRIARAQRRALKAKQGSGVKPEDTSVDEPMSDPALMNAVPMQSAVEDHQD